MIFFSVYISTIGRDVQIYTKTIGAILSAATHRTNTAQLSMGTSTERMSTHNRTQTIRCSRFVLSILYLLFVVFIGWSVLCDEPVKMMSVYVPEKDMSFDVLEIIEHPEYLAFHRQTLNLYCKLCSQGNQKVAHMLCDHVDQEQIMYAIKSHGEC